MTREEWLNVVAKQMAPWYTELGVPLPRFRVSIGFTGHGKRGSRIGECWSRYASKDKHCEIFLRPDLDKPIEVAATLAHELVHAAVGLKAKHGGEFKRVAIAIGLEGKMTATYAGEKFKARIEPILYHLGDLPHARLNFNSADRSGPPKQTTRLMKVECPDCGYTVRITRKWLEIGNPLCPLHGEMKEEER